MLVRELMVTPEAARLEAKEEVKDSLGLDLAAGVMVTPEVDRPAKMALVSMMVTLSFSGLAFDLAEEASACNAFGSSMVTTCSERDYHYYHGAVN